MKTKSQIYLQAVRIEKKAFALAMKAPDGKAERWFAVKRWAGAIAKSLY